MALRPQRPPDAQTPACPCRHGDVPEELAGQRPLLERAAAGDREAFALVYDDQVEGVYRYLLAWTGNPTEAAELTSRVFHSAIGWLPTTNGGEGEAAAWLIAMSRDALTARTGPPGPTGPAGDVVAAVGRLPGPEREVVVLRLLLGHSLDHTAHLSGYSHRAVLELQLAGCLAIHDLTAGRHAGPGSPEAPPVPAAEEFERHLARRELALTGADPAIAGALAVAGSLRQAIPGYVAAPTHEFVERLRAELVTGRPAPTLSERLEAAGSDPFPVLELAGGVSATAASPAGGRAGGSRAGTGVSGWLARRPWLATGVATAGIMVVLGLQAFGGEGGPRECGGRPCPVSTTAAVAAGEGDGSRIGAPLTTVVKSTTSTTAGAGEAAPTAAPTSAVTSPPTTRPATTAAPTTAASRPTTTTRATTTTAPTTTLPTTTTTAAPAPP